MTNLSGILDKVLSSNVGTSAASGLAGGVAGSMLMSKKGRKLGKSALKVGGIAAIGALAYSAYKKYSTINNQTTSVAVDHSAQFGSESDTKALETAGYLPAAQDQQAIETLESVLVSAMIAASRADGNMDVQESQAIFKQIRCYDLSAEHENALIEQMSKPVDMDALVAAAVTPEIAAEIYTVSVLTMNEINESERNYLTMLSMRLNMPRQLTYAIENEVSHLALTGTA